MTFSRMFSYSEPASNDSPILLRIEDLHWADSLTHRLICHIARRSQIARLMVIATAREEELTWKDRRGSGSSEELIGDLATESEIVVLHLYGLDRYELTKLLSKASSSPLDVDLSDMIHGQTDGNPLISLWVLEDLMERGQLTNGNGYLQAKGHLPISIPLKVCQLINERMDRLDPLGRELVESASIIGYHFDDGWLGAFFKEDEISLRLSHVIQDIGIICHDIDGYRFAHDIFRTSIYDNIDLKRRVAMHAQFATWMELNLPNSPLAFLSDQFELGGIEEKASLYALRAGSEYLEHFAAKEALSYFTRAAQGRDACDPIWSVVMNGVGDSLFELGDYQGSFEVLQQLSRGDITTKERDKLLIKMADLWAPGRLGVAHKGRLQEYLGQVKEIEALDPEDQGEYWGYLSVLALWENDRVRSIGLSNKALECYRKAGRWDKIAFEMTNQGVAMAAYGDAIFSLNLLMQVMEIYNRHPRIRGEETAYLALGEVNLSLGFIDDARDCFVQTLSRATKSGEVLDMVWAHYYLSMVSLFDEDPENALAHSRLCQEFADCKQYHLLSCMPLWSGFLCHLLMKDDDHARDTYRELKRRYEQYKAEYRSSLDGLVACASSMIEEMQSGIQKIEDFEEGLRQLDSGQYKQLNELFVRWIYSIWLVDRGVTVPAISQLQKALPLAEKACSYPMMERILEKIASLNYLELEWKDTI